MEKDEIFKNLEKWLEDKGDCKYQDEFDFVKNLNEGFLSPVPAIQQNKKEIEEFISVLLNKKVKGTAMEIGLGFYGSTHFLWRHIFDNTITVEMSWERIKEFGLNMNIFHDKYIMKDGKSRFVHGFSYEPKTISKVNDLVGLKKVDLLFIDGHHSYESVLTDFWIYKNFVKEGGIIAFDDYLFNNFNYCVRKFVDKLEKGLIDGKKYFINKIFHSKYAGIVWLENNKLSL